MSEEIFICRTCLTPTPAQSCKIISEYEDSRILEMLSFSIPELDMYMVTNPVICDKCLLMLKTTFEFKSKCLNNEERLLKYIHKFGIKNVDFSDYFDHMGIDKTKLVVNNNYQKSTTANNVKPKLETKSSLHKQSLKKNNSSNLKKTLDCKKCRGCTLKVINNPCLHLKVNISPFICAICDRQYKQIGDLRKHMLGHTKQRQCQVCEKSFRDMHVLRKHLWSHTGAKLFACHLCPKQFQQKHGLKQHIQQHEGNDNISCKICKKLFSTKYNAQVHMKSAHKIREFCDLCRTAFKTRADFVKHIQHDSKNCIQKANEFFEKEQAEENFLKSEPDSVPLDIMTIKDEPIEESSEGNTYELSTVIKNEFDSGTNELEIDVVN